MLRWPAMVGSRRHALPALALVAVAASTPAVTEQARLPSQCHVYFVHLRNARAYLARGERPAAVGELRQALRAFDTCAQRGETALAARQASPSGG